MWKLLTSCAIGISAYHLQADGQTKRMNCTIGQILYANLLYKDQEKWLNYVAVTEMAFNCTINASINKASFEVLYSQNTPLPVDLLLPRESSINPHNYTFTRKMKQLVNKVKNAIYEA